MNRLGYILLAVMFFCVLGFQKSTQSDRDLAIQKEIENRLQEFRITKEKECKKTAMERAEEIVDSVIHKQNAIPKIDSMETPLRPVKPLNEKQISIDTTEEVKPLFEKQG